MKFTSMFFTASDSIFEIYLKDSKKRAKKKQREAIFFRYRIFSTFILFMHNTLGTNWRKLCKFAHLYYRKT